MDLLSTKGQITVVTPSGVPVVLRELTAGDQDDLTARLGQENDRAFDLYLAAGIVKIGDQEMPFVPSTASKGAKEEAQKERQRIIGNLFVRDVDYLLMWLGIHNFGFSEEDSIFETEYRSAGEDSNGVSYSVDIPVKIDLWNVLRNCKGFSWVEEERERLRQRAADPEDTYELPDNFDWAFPEMYSSYSEFDDKGYYEFQVGRDVYRIDLLRVKNKALKVNQTNALRTNERLSVRRLRKMVRKTEDASMIPSLITDISRMPLSIMRHIKKGLKKAEAEVPVIVQVKNPRNKLEPISFNFLMQSSFLFLFHPE